MRRSSIITIVLLVLVIIGLVVALVVTNLPQEEDGNEDTVVENNESVEDEQQEEIVEETPTSVSLDSQIVKDMYSLLSGQTQDIFHYLIKGSLTVDDLSNEYIQTIAYFNGAKDKVEKFDTIDNQMRDGKLEKKYMDEAVKKIFGDVEYEPTYALVQSNDNARVLRYDENEGVYYEYTGFGGGGNFASYTAITKVDEYSDKYVVTEKLVTLLDQEGGNYTVFPYYGTSFKYSYYIENTTSSDIQNISVTHDVYSSNETAEKLISKYYDDATEYQHTFMKNDDGTYYWVKTEIVK